MSVARARAPKPKTADEVARVLRIHDFLADEMARRGHGPQALVVPQGSPVVFTPGLPLLEIADRIAARTED